MGNAQTRDRLKELLDGPMNGLGLDLEAVELSQAGKRRVLRIAVDIDGGITMDDIAAATAEISRVLDETDVMGTQPYTLEVSSPGVDRPLTAPRHWRRNVGRLVKVILEEGGSVTGRVTGSDGEAVTLEAEDVTRQVPYAGIRSARVQVEFKRPDHPQSEAPDASDDETDAPNGDEESP